jgi:hypothetical protein
MQYAIGSGKIGIDTKEFLFLYFQAYLVTDFDYF